MVIRSTTEARKAYFDAEGTSHSDFKKIFEWLDPSKKVKPESWDEQKRYNRLGNALHCLLMRHGDWDNEFFVLDCELPSDQVTPILNYAFETAMFLNGYVSDNPTMHQDIILQACVPGVVTPKGYGGSWSDERKMKTMLDDKALGYWQALYQAKDLIRISPEEKALLDDEARRVKQSEWFGPLFDDASYDHPGIYCYFEFPILDVKRKNGLFKGKGMLDILIVNTTDKEFRVGSIVVGPNRYKVIDIKRTEKSSGAGEYFLRSYRADRQLAWYNKLASFVYPLMRYEEPAILLVSSVPYSDPLMWELSENDHKAAIYGLNKKGEPMKREENEEVMATRARGVVHGLQSMIIKYEAHLLRKSDFSRELSVVDNKGIIKTTLWNEQNDELQ